VGGSPDLDGSRRYAGSSGSGRTGYIGTVSRSLRRWSDCDHRCHQDAGTRSAPQQCVRCSRAPAGPPSACWT